MKLLYFAWVRQKVGRGEEDVEVPATVRTAGELLTWLRGRGGGYADAFAEPARIRIAVNQEHGGPGSAVRQGDEVAFFPPVTGG